MINKSRITADWDTKNKIVIAYRLFKTFLLIKNINSIELLESPGKRGFHLIIFTSKFYTEKQIFLLRKMINDDKYRIKIDKIRGYNLQTLFYKREYD